MYKFTVKTAAFVGCVIKYGCYAHCTFEYVGDFVVVSLN